MILFKRDKDSNVKVDSFIVFAKKCDEINNELRDKIDVLEKRLQKVCKHEEGFKFSYTTDELRYFRPSRKCEICGLIEIYENRDNYLKAREEQEYNDAKKIVEKYEGEK
jgi:hypothetical protein